jgi:hypothetical protein
LAIFLANQGLFGDVNQAEGNIQTVGITINVPVEGANHEPKHSDNSDEKSDDSLLSSIEWEARDAELIHEFLKWHISMILIYLWIFARKTK